MFQDNNVDSVCRKWTESLLNIARQFIPNKVVTIRPNDAPFYNAELRRMKRGVMRKYSLAKRTQNPTDWDSYRMVRNEYTDALREAKEQYSLKVASDLRSCENINPKRWWHSVKNLMGRSRQSQYPPLNVHGTMINDPKLKAEAFNEYFASQTVLADDNVSLPQNYPQFEHSSLCDIVITEEEVLDQIKAIKSNKATGPDLVSPRMIKEAAESICPSLTKLFNLSLRCGVVPAMWKEANVIPIHKKKDKGDIKNYRPVSLLSCVGKLHERVIFKHVYNYMHDNNLLSRLQSGFRPGDCTVNQLIDIYHTISHALDKKKHVRLVFCDISKAFDKVWHTGLLFKLSKLGIQGSMLTWFRNYLSDRKQRVCLQGQSSNWAPILAGVPQGSVLGPLLFLVYINDIVNEVKSNIRLFADDTTLHIEVFDPQVAADMLNVDLNSISSWAKQWLVTFSPEKTTSMVCSLRQKSAVPDLLFNGTILEDVTSHRHLGITLSNDMSWQKHLEDITVRANKRLDILCCLSSYIDRQTLSKLYVSFVRPILEYGDTLFNSACSQQQSHMLEAVQKRAARIITGCIRGTPSKLMYDDLGWNSLKERRDHHCLCLFYNINNGRAPDYLFERLPELVGDKSTYNLRNRANVSVIPSRTSSFHNTFFPATIRMWNALDPGIRELESIAVFKRSIMPKKQTNPLFSYGPRRTNVYWSRIRLGCSSLKAQLHAMHIILDPKCPCGYEYEDPYHFFFQCVLYNRQRVSLMETLQKLNLSPDLMVLLHGSEKLNYSENVVLIQSVFDFIIDTKRFD